MTLRTHTTPVHSGKVVEKPKTSNVGTVEWLAQQPLDFSAVDWVPEGIQEKVGNPAKWSDSEVEKFFVQNSDVAAIIRHNPASLEMLELMYFGSDVHGQPLMKNGDFWFMSTLPAQALRDRLDFCTEWLADWIMSKGQVWSNGLRILDLGAGPGPYAFKTLKKLHFSKSFLEWVCVDCDPLALEAGGKKATRKGLQEIVKFKNLNFLSGKSYPVLGHNSDLIVLIGILCGMSVDDAIFCLRKIKPYLRQGGEILAATLLKKAFLESPHVFRILSNVTGWCLRPKEWPTVRYIFNAAGYRILNEMSERRDGDGEYAIVHAQAI